ncbi:MAG: efflux RND transporter permease subunit, partial [Gemmatimonadetes bacterium]|nr:efflux RND transporter permease subunit [Gemmatimonadota bacterium]
EVFLNNVAFLRVRDELTRVNGVSEVMVFGTEYGMRVWLDPDRMQARDLTTNDIVAAIREQNVEVAAGKIGEPPAPAGQTFELIVGTEGRLTEVEQFENLIVNVGSDGRVVYLRDVATVELGAQSYNLVCRHNGETTSVMVIYPIPGANWVATADAIRAKLEELRPTFPRGVQHSVAYDATDVIRASIKEVVVTLFITLALVVFSVYIFLQDFRATLIPAVTIPVSLVGTFAVMAALGYSLNILTLFGLILVIGIVVDDAIVVVENTSRLLDEGKSRVEAAKQSMVEVSGPVVATTLVLLAVFVPTVFMGGIVGSLFSQFAVTISIATVFSSINALTLSPALCALLLRPRPEKQAAPFRMFNAALAWSTNEYASIVRRALRVAPLALVVFVGLIALAAWGFSRIPSGFVPQEDEGWFLLNVQLPDAASQERTIAVTNRVNDILLETEGIKDVVIINGFSFLDSSRSTNTAGAIVTLEPWEDRSTPELFQEAIVRNVNMKCREIQEALVFALTPPSLPGLGNASGITLQLQDRGGVGAQSLASVATEVATTGNEQSAITGMFTTFRASVPQLFLDIDREQIKTKGIPLQSVFDTLAAYLGSVYVNDFTRFGRIYQVRVQADPSRRSDPAHIEGLQLRSPGGEMIPLGTVMSVNETVGPQTITHFNIYPAARINAQAAPGFSTGQAMDIFEQMAEVSLPPSIGYEWTDVSYQEKAAQGAASVIFLFSILMVYLVLAAQYESWSIPFSVVLAVPTALLGATAGVIIGGFDNNVYTQIGIVLLIGLSAKTAILIVEFAKARREEGASIMEAAVDAARLRFRAVLMTAASFILGVIPLLVATGAGAASRRVLGTVVFTGMLAATLIGVIAIPLLYFIIQWISELRRKPVAAA